MQPILAGGASPGRFESDRANKRHASSGTEVLRSLPANTKPPIRGKGLPLGPDGLHGGGASLKGNAPELGRRFLRVRAPPARGRNDC